MKRTSLVAAGVVGFPYIIRSAALGKDGAVAPSNRRLMAQFGSGSMGMADLQAFLNLGPEVQVVAICDVDDRRAQNGKVETDKYYKNQDCRTYRDYREMLDKEHLDIVSLALPDHWHAIASIACARKGIDMYGQKPLSRTLGEGRLICDAVKRYGVIWQTGSWQRSVREFHHACELVLNGRIGKVAYVEVGLPDGPKAGQVKPMNVPKELDWDLWLGPAPWREFQDFGHGDCHWDWRWILDYSGGMLTDWAGHHIDIAHWGLGLDYAGPVEIEGRGEYPQDGLWNTPYAYDFTATYANGLKMRVANESKQPHGMGICWYGEKGWIYVTRDGLQASNAKILEEKIGPDEHQLYKSDNHQKNLLDCVKTRQQTITPAEVAHRSLSVGLLGEIAMLRGKKLQWNPQTEQFVNDPEAARLLMRAYRSPWHV